MPEPGGTPGLTPSRGGRSARFVTDVLGEMGYASPERIEQAIAESRVAGRPPERILLEQGTIDSDQLSRAVAERYGLDHVDLTVYPVDMAAANLIPIEAARRYQAVPIGYAGSEVLLVAMADPANVLAADDIRMATGLGCRIVVGNSADIEALIGRLNNLQGAVTEAVDSDQAEEAEELEALSDLHASAQDAPVVKLVYSILGQAVSEGASDIHFEPGEADMRVRFRIDGVLHEAAHVPRRMVSAVVSRIKIMSDLDIAEKRVPQDGRVSVNISERRVDLRVTTLPTQGGEGATIRILDMEQRDALARRPRDGGRSAGTIRSSRSAVPTARSWSPARPARASRRPSTPLCRRSTKSRRTSSRSRTRSSTSFAGINQLNVNPRAGLTFANGLRSILRADPDIIMVGEIRDAETARIGIEAALTGHMVLSTLHTNDAPGAITRLSKMGIESFLTASAVDCVVAQRLARTLCQNCKRRVVVPASAVAEAGFGSMPELEAYEPVGCGRCSQSGYRGRLGLYSVMSMSTRIKEMAVAGVPEADISEVARQEGMQTLREDGLLKVRDGVTSLEEVVRVTA